MFPIAISLAPNLRFKDALQALSFLVFPWKWGSLRKGKWEKSLETRIGQYYDRSVFTFESGRSALFAIFRCLDFEKDDEVLVQGYTCIVVSNSIVWNGLKPVYVDIEEDTWNMDPKKIEEKITKKTRAIVIQHTFGKPANLEAILNIAKKHALLVIEDCAHAIGSKYQEKPLGTFGDFAILSFGRDKVISSVHGGAVIVKDTHHAERMKKYQKSLPFPSALTVFRHLAHSVLCFFFVLPWYDWHIGKMFLFLAQKLSIVSKVFVVGEKQAIRPKNFPARFPNALARLAFLQWQAMPLMNEKRKAIAKYYRERLKELPLRFQREDENEENIYMRFSFQTDHAKELYFYAKQKKILLGDWYDTPIAPKGCSFERAGYHAGDCPIAEKVSKKTLNLPTYLRLTDLQKEKTVQILQAFFSEKK